MSIYPGSLLCLPRARDFVMRWVPRELLVRGRVVGRPRGQPRGERAAHETMTG